MCSWTIVILVRNKSLLIMYVCACTSLPKMTSRQGVRKPEQNGSCCRLPSFQPKGDFHCRSCMDGLKRDGREHIVLGEIGFILNLLLFISQSPVTEEKVQRVKKRFMSAYDVTADGRLQIQEVPSCLLFCSVRK